MNQTGTIIVGALFMLCASCGGSKKNYTIPATYPTQEFNPPDEDELSGEDDFFNIEADDDNTNEEEASSKEETTEPKT